METYLQYLKDISHYKSINETKEKELSTIIESCEDAIVVEKAKEEMILANLNLVVIVANKVYHRFNRKVDVMGLIAEGNRILMMAVNNYSPNHSSNARFASYISLAMERAMMEYIFEDRLIHLPIYMLQNKTKMEKLKEKYKDKLTDSLIRKELKIGDNVLKAIKGKIYLKVMFFGDMFDGDSDEIESRIDNVMSVETFPSPLDNLITKFSREYFVGLLCLLTSREKEVIESMFLSDSELSYSDIARKLNVTRQNVAHIGHLALRKLRTAIINDWNRNNPNDSIDCYSYCKEEKYLKASSSEELQDKYKRVIKEFV